MTHETAPATLERAAGKACVALRAAWGSVPEAPEGDVAWTIVRLAETPAGREVGAEGVLRAMTRACVARADAPAVPAAVSRLLGAVHSVASQLGLGRRAASRTIIRCAMLHPRLSGDAGERVLGDLLRRD